MNGSFGTRYGSECPGCACRADFTIIVAWAQES